MIRFYIPGQPPNAWGKNGKEIAINPTTGKPFPKTKASTKATNQMLKEAFGWQYKGEPMTGAVAVTVYVTWRFRKADIGKHVGAIRKTTKPDGDNVLASIFDSLEQAGVLVNDSQIAEFTFSKWWGDQPSIAVTVESL